jgi:excisionase family DNA binding protein
MRPATPSGGQPDAPSGDGHWRGQLRDVALQRAMTKRLAGVPSYTVPEAAALLSISAEYLYRLIRQGQFPAVCMRPSGTHGRYIIAAAAVNGLLDQATTVDLAQWAKDWQAAAPGTGVA